MRVDEIIGYECKKCGAKGSFDQFPHFNNKNEFGTEIEVFCMNKECDGQNEDLWEVVEKGEEFDINELLE